MVLYKPLSQLIGVGSKETTSRSLSCFLLDDELMHFPRKETVKESSEKLCLQKRIFIDSFPTSFFPFLLKKICFVDSDMKCGVHIRERTCDISYDPNKN